MRRLMAMQKALAQPLHHSTSLALHQELIEPLSQYHWHCLVLGDLRHMERKERGRRQGQEWD